MSDVPFGCGEENESLQGSNSCSDAVCISAERIYDSCGAKDCLTDLQLMFSDEHQKIADSAYSARICKASVITATVDVEPVAFHRGFYAVDMVFYFDVAVEVYTSTISIPVTINGLAVYGKRVVLYGSESSAKYFDSESYKFYHTDKCNVCAQDKNLPKASVQVSDPMALSAKVVPAHKPCQSPCGAIPESVKKHYGCEFVHPKENKILVTIGIFTITQLQRTVQLMVPSYDFCIPEKECPPQSDDPCEVFSKIEFPTDSFFPPKVDDCKREAPHFECKCK